MRRLGFSVAIESQGGQLSLRRFLAVLMSFIARNCPLACQTFKGYADLELAWSIPTYAGRTLVGLVVAVLGNAVKAVAIASICELPTTPSAAAAATTGAAAGTVTVSVDGVQRPGTRYRGGGFLPTDPHHILQQRGYGGIAVFGQRST